MLELDPSVASAMFKSERMVDIPIYQSTLLSFVGKDNDTDFKVIKKVNISNETGFNISDAKFVLSPENKVFLSIRINIEDLHERDFVSVSKERTGEFIDSFNKRAMKRIDTSILSEQESKKKLDEVRDKYSGVNDDSFLIVNS
jgi:hypothetical protein